MFKPLWDGGRALVMADAWYEWKNEGKGKQPYYIQHKSKSPIFLACIGKAPFDNGSQEEGFLVLTTASKGSLADIHNRMPVVFTKDAALAWMNEDADGADATEIVNDGAVDSDEFIWHQVGKAVGNIKNQGPDLIDEV